MLTSWPKERAKEPVYPFPGEEGVRQELERIIESSAFKATPRRKKLLRYLVEELLAGRGHELKGYTIATLVFGRDESFDPQTDPVVRLEARRLRHDLDSYYVSAGRGNPLRISIPKGQYAPTIEKADTDTPAVPVTSAATEGVYVAPELGPENTAVSSKLFRRATLAAAIAIVLIFAAVIYATVFSQPGSFSRSSAVNSTALAVLPFETEGDDPANAALAKDMADEIMNGLSRFEGIHLYMPSAADKSLSGPDPIEFGNRLNLTYVVNGTINAAAEKMLRVNVRLIDVRSQRILWIGSYDRSYSAERLNALQREIAPSVASVIGQPDGRMRVDEVLGL
ncbi:TolB-like protein [Pararhizobium capsulatum DSM 1112]|uniref:TolB-like protein n=1 Tax=Pararhizobium capsulatum DSM 1112 TaxID=1121113 RepID=A0ABU0BTC6_9HYPH|nr:hypothetical protein [Pararhizobium capsulatum]MDQ0321522.1 TolB-like protein [Pararhizobium capsulatum DSM 1112]